MSLEHADVDVIIEVFRDMLVMAVIPGYKRDHKKYNLQMLAGISVPGNESDEERPTVNVAELIRRKKEAAAAAINNI